MAVIKVTLPLGEIPVNGKQVTFVAPCSCLDTEALDIEGEQYAIVDSLGNPVTEIGGRWVEGAIVSVILDVDNRLAYILSESAGITFEIAVTGTWLADTANGGYLQMVELDGILATDNPIADVVMGDDVDANELYAKAWSCITRIFTEDDMVTLYANKEAPTTAFNMQLKVVR